MADKILKEDGFEILLEDDSGSVLKEDGIPEDTDGFTTWGSKMWGVLEWGLKKWG